MSRVAAYVRCSTDKQEDSPEVQLGLIREYAAREGHEIVACYADEGISGGAAIESRPAFRQLLQEREAKQFSAVVILRIDRFSRDLFDFLSFERAAKAHKLQVIYATESFEDNATGDLMKRVKVLFAEHERRSTGVRIREHNRHLAAVGRWPSGRPPLGFSYDKETKTLGINEDRQQDAVTVFRTFVKCQGNFTRTAYTLNVAGIRTRQGNLWSHDAVRALVTNPLFRGRYRYHDIEAEHENIPRLVPTDLLAGADTYIRNTATHRTKALKSIYTYSSLLICTMCGYTFRVHHVGRGHEMYACRGHKEHGICKAPKVSSRWLDLLVGEALEHAFMMERDAILSAEGPELESDGGAAHKQRLGALRQRRKRTQDLYVCGLIESVDELKSRIGEIDKQIGELERAEPHATFTAEEVAKVLDRFGEHWKKATVEYRRSILLVVAPRIYLDSTERRITLDTTLAAGRITLPV